MGNWSEPLHSQNTQPIPILKVVSVAVVNDTLVINEVVLPFDSRMDRIVMVEVEGRT